MLKSSILLWVACLISVPLSAQSVSAPERMQWRAHGEMLSLDLDASTPEVRVERRGKKVQTFRLPPKCMPMGIQDDRVYAFTRDRTHHRTRILSAVLPCRNWEVVGDLPFETAEFMTAVPLGNGGFLVNGGLSPIRLGDNASFWALLKVDDQGRLRVTSLVQPDLKQSLCERAAVGPQGSEFRFRSGYDVFQQAMLEVPIRTPDGIVWVSKETGYLFVFDPETGRHRRTIRLYDVVGENLLPEAVDKLEPPILCVQSLPSGNLVLAARTEDAVLHARTIFPTASNRRAIPESSKPEHQRAIRDGHEAFSDILYWEVNLTSGDRFQATVPTGWPRRIWNPSVFASFRFTTDLAGKWSRP